MIPPNDINFPEDWNLRELELQQVSHALANDEDLIIAGVPGSGRRTLVRRAAKENNALIIEIDCIRAMDSKSFVKLLYENYAQVFRYPEVKGISSQWVKKEASELFVLSKDSSGKQRLKPTRSLSKLGLNEPEDEAYLWQTFKVLLSFPQYLGKNLDRRVVLVLHSLPHIRCWDREQYREHDKNKKNKSEKIGVWEESLRNEIEKQENVSYIMVTTIAEKNSEVTNNFKALELAPLSDENLARWIRKTLNDNHSAFNPLGKGLETFLETVQGHYSDARSLARRLLATQKMNKQIGEEQVQQATVELLENFSAVFETLLELLPLSQAQLLECLALYPTDKPQSRDYIQDHSLSKGGTLQSAIKGLQKKGLIYGPELGYRPALPLLTKWICQQLG
jgi:hypothetical protein